MKQKPVKDFLRALTNLSYDAIMHPGERFRSLRDDLHLDQADIADRLGLERSQIAQFEGNPNPKWTDILQMLGGLRVSIARFFESAIPDQYPDPTHQELHEKLEQILLAGGEKEIGIRVNIEAISKALQEEKSKLAAAKKRENKRKMKKPKDVFGPAFKAR